ncbi:HYD1 signature containing ADP-ribosyltransferase family protein [Flavobacterium branchiophilum]|uniref:HYD1 signature containing ADP-ribosyltransferase family protein n=2 Tax=Flavobacterium branchiophilum TaxID=55197 RepID=UPI0002ED0F10|nr:HYD1 signature containing ADP-ribosyltransferase family protein [Flavobacterium branchiophilum]
MRGEKKYSILADHLGTPIEAYADDGNLIWSRELNSNGKVLKETGIQNFCPFLYQGQSFDNEIELAYNRFRYYDVEDGRYISQDPIGLLSGEFGFYNYVHDTNGWIDSLGLEGTYRVRHYTNKKGRDGIEKDNLIVAKDQNKVFTVKAKGRMSKGSSKDLESKLGIKPGKAKNYVEFDVKPEEVTIIDNPITGATEHVLNGDVSLEGRNPIFK